MTTKIIQSIQALVRLNPDEEKAFLDILMVRKLKKKEFLLREGDVCGSISFINEGCMRLFYNVEGVENTFQFFFGDNWYTDYASFLTGAPSHENLQALEASEVVQFRRADALELFDRYPIFDRVGRIMAERAYLSLSKLNQMLTNETPQQRYLNLIKQRPDVVERIPQRHIASFLGVKPESLSRIRKRILDMP